MKLIAVVVCTLLLVSTIVSAAPSYADYENARELYELLLQKDLIDSMGNSLIDPNHRMVRKNQRSPSLRLRFGRRSDPAFYQNALNAEYHNDSDVN
ncbi:short neuropeptide F [Sipha flava]|uniref:Short neuropeptide F n=1 Tax=Sipha flava TaxID=143950 RepID=A0A8B8FL59_9HEMI|nr:short neuropeptide F [Sipha flava]XP_025411080.1 short neuropeptide F [Sipha flava]